MKKRCGKLAKALNREAKNVNNVIEQQDLLSEAIRETKHIFRLRLFVGGRLVTYINRITFNLHR